MSNLIFKGNLQSGDTGIKTNLSLLSFVEEGIHIIYSPALDLSGYGNTEGEAKESFEVVLSEFFNYCMNKKTVFDELKRLGWKVKGNRKHPKVESPDMSELLKNNTDLEDFFQKKEFYKYNKEVMIPAY